MYNTGDAVRKKDKKIFVFLFTNTEFYDILIMKVEEGQTSESKSFNLERRIKHD